MPGRMIFLGMAWQLKQSFLAFRYTGFCLSSWRVLGYMYHVCVGQSGSTQTPVHSVVSLFNTVGIPLNGGKAQKLRLVQFRLNASLAIASGSGV